MELVGAVLVCKAVPQRGGSAYGHHQQHKMSKSVFATGLLGLVEAAVVLLPVSARPASPYQKFTPLTDGNTPMIASSSSAPNADRIDVLSRAAIREEIGDRLRISLPTDFGRLPQNMMMLIEQIACDRSPMSRINRKTEVSQ
jgi:hypothetical protein